VKAKLGSYHATKYNTDDLRICATKEVIPPAQVHDEMPINDTAAQTTLKARAEIHKILTGGDDRLLVVVGPCSIHDPIAVRICSSFESAQRWTTRTIWWLLCVVYFEKPRTTVGGKAWLTIPTLIPVSISIKVYVLPDRYCWMWLHSACLQPTEYLDLISPQYVSDLIAWGAIGARTTESQGHRELASGVSCPIGFKNSTDGTIKIAIDQ